VKIIVSKNKTISIISGYNGIGLLFLPYIKNHIALIIPILFIISPSTAPKKKYWRANIIDERRQHINIFVLSLYHNDRTIEIIPNKTNT
jgi:hypothetical protein